MRGVQDGVTTPGAPRLQYPDTGTPDHLWELVPAGQGSYLIRNLGSGLVMGVAGAQTTNSAAITQQAPNGSPNQSWQLLDEAANGQFRLRNRNSGLLLGVNDESTSGGGQIVQFQDNGTPDHLWQMEPAALPTARTLATASCEQSLIR